jgi:hypothetical protein
MSRAGGSLRDDFIRIQKRIAARLRREIFSMAGLVSDELRGYQRAYESSLRGFRRWTDRACLLDSLLGADIALLGDFHTLARCQDAALDLLEELSRMRRVVLAVEMVPREKQLALDTFVSRHIEEGEFLAAVDWEENWGFEWKNYRPLFEFARERELQVFGTNTCCPLEGERLRQRDAIAAEVIVRAAVAHPEALVIAISGDFHLSRAHLPAAVERQLCAERLARRLVVVHQNADAFYWELAARGLEREVDVVEVGPDEFCLMNTTPVAKYQSYFHWETGAESLLAGDGACLGRERPVEEALGRMIRTIRDFLGLESAEPDTFHVYTPSDLDFLDDLAEREAVGPRDLDEVKRQLLRQESYFISGANVIYLADLSLDHAAEEASHYVHERLAPHPRRPLPARTDFYYRALREALGFLGSKAVNPRRFHYSEDEYLEVARAYRTRPSDPRVALAVDISRFVVRHLDAERARLAGGRLPKLRAIYEQDEDLHLGVTHALGYLLGERLYAAVVAGRFSRRELRGLYSWRLEEDDGAERMYFGLLRRLAAVE